ncbi:UNVERIFIED_CONTAM: hypothetical protein HDU68_004458 [Siphonaria sp. JEL0065]|nr:hypothetical protein HDU68_004458 [Siphonaria sp. JEL0065]
MIPDSDSMSATVQLSATGVPETVTSEHKLLARAVVAEALDEAMSKSIEAKLEAGRIQTMSDRKLAVEAGQHWVSYFKTHSATYSDAVQPVFPKAYHALINIPSLFDTLMELERTYALAVAANVEETLEQRKALIYSLENSRRSSLSSHHDDQGRLFADANQAQRRMSIAEAREELMIFDATRESLLAELRSSQKAEYRDFVIKVHNELLILANQPPTESETATVKTHLKNTDAIASSIGKLVTEGDRVLEGAVGKLRRAPSHSMMRVGSLEGLLSGNNSGSSTPPAQEPAEPESTPLVSADPEMDHLVKEVKEMGFTEDQATAALDLSKRNLQQAITVLLETPELVEKQIRDTATRKMLFAANHPSQKLSLAQQQGQRSVSGGSHKELHRTASSGSLKRSNSTNTNPWNTTPRLPGNSPLAAKRTDVAVSSDEVTTQEPQPQQPKTFSPFAFIQQQQAKISADFAAIAAAATGAPTPPTVPQQPQSSSGTSTPATQFNNLQKGFTSFLGKAMEALHIEPLPLQQKQQQSEGYQFDELSESFTAYFGTQVRTMYSLRVSVVPSLCDVVFHGGSGLDSERDALRAQTAAGLYSNNLSGCIVLVKASLLQGYGLGRTANRAFIKKCKQATEFHFDDIEIQLQKAIDACPLDEFGNPALKEGDFFITRHSNIPQIHVLFHLIISEDDTPKELSSQSNIIIGYRNILKLAHLRDINNLTVPMLFLPENHSAQKKQSGESSRASTSSAISTSPSRNSTNQTPQPQQLPILENTSLIQKRVETVLKSTKGLIIEQTRSIKHSGDSSGVDKRSRSIQFVMTLDAGGSGGKVVRIPAVEDSFHAVCGKVAEVFRTS